MSMRTLFTHALVFFSGCFLGRIFSGYEDAGSASSSSSLHDSDYSRSVGSAFDHVQRTAYDLAIKKPKKSFFGANNRKPYALGDVKETQGGLRETDRLLLGKLYYNAKSVFEFGLGESTHIAAHVGVPRYSGIDSDASWVTYARDGIFGNDHFRFYFADIGKTGLWGYPNNTALGKIPYDYQIAPLAAEMEAFDVYLVDGRYRVACAAVSFLHAMDRGGDMSEVMVGMHDTDHRPAYKKIKDVADVVRSSERLWVLKLKPDVTEEDLLKLW
eukprot:CAMPEP_0183719400 /NCGR_PEP_ID=MMETSP0737-20130205/12357_1 /TAXON_ID=385413 /ORGANISM="Thalassiosira miniscula, Strain CCMP1093" /LENGTH=270 /DNA_ID=CAMNT_0025949117 /DNA_START=71 /DNA_END=880 /DNA_ORIENTATION=+